MMDLQKKKKNLNSNFEEQEKALHDGLPSGKLCKHSRFRDWLMNADQQIVIGGFLQIDQLVDN